MRSTSARGVSVFPGQQDTRGVGIVERLADAVDFLMGLVALAGDQRSVVAAGLRDRLRDRGGAWSRCTITRAGSANPAMMSATMASPLRGADCRR